LLKTLIKGVMVIAIAALVLLLLKFSLQLMGESYKKQIWDPNTVALVNDRPISRESVDELLKLGFYPPLSLEGKAAKGSMEFHQVVDILIEEALVLQAAEREGIVVPEAEVHEAVKILEPSWQCEGDKSRDCFMPKGEEREALNRAVRMQLTLSKLTQTVSTMRGKRTAAEWGSFLDEWTKRYSMPSVYKVRILLAQKDQAVRKIMESRKNLKNGLQGLEERLTERGFPSVISEPMYLDPARVAEAGIFEGVSLRQELIDAARAGDKLSGVLPLSESWGVIEILKVLPQVNPEAMVRAARNSYENTVSSRAFRDFVEDLRAQAKIEMNPNFPMELEREDPASAPEAREADKPKEALATP
jgi:hypothetical protein